MGFGAEADTYERSRPSYPPDAVAWVAAALDLRPGRSVADVAAGTGKLTRLLVPTGAWVLAVEPVGGMSAVLRAELPEVSATAGVAEALPLRAGAVDAVAVAQGFHWFDARAALAEFHRVLPPRGRVALLWNARDRTVPWVDALWSVMDRVERKAPWRDHDNWRDTAFVDQPWFGPLVGATFHHQQLLTRDAVIERLKGVSHVAVLPPREQAAVLDEVRRIIDTHPAIAHHDELAIPYRVDAYWCERLTR